MFRLVSFCLVPLAVLFTVTPVLSTSTCSINQWSPVVIFDDFPILDGQYNSVALDTRWSPDGQLLAIKYRADFVSTANIIEVFETTTWRSLGTLASPIYGFIRMEWSPDSNILALMSHDNILTLWNVNDFSTPLVTMPLSEDLRPIWSPDSTQIALVNHQHIVIFNTTNFELEENDFQSIVPIFDRTVEWSGDTLRYVTVDEHETIHIVDVGASEHTLALTTYEDSSVSSLWLSPQADRLMVSADSETFSYRLDLWHIETSQRLWHFEADTSVEQFGAFQELSWPQDSSCLAVLPRIDQVNSMGGTTSLETRSIIILDMNTGEEVTRITQEYPVENIQLSSDGLMLATIDTAGVVTVWSSSLESR